MKELIKKIINEETSSVYEFACLMVQCGMPQMNEIHNMISEDDIYREEGDRSYGLEDDPHVTVLFGLHDSEVTTEEVMEIAKRNKRIFEDVESLELKGPSLFENEDYDVLKFDVSHPYLTKTNKLLTKLPHTNDYPDYHPHMTIGYLKPGMGKKYVRMMEGTKYMAYPTGLLYSKPSGEKINEEF